MLTRVYVDNADTFVMTHGRYLILKWRDKASVEGMASVQLAYEALRAQWGIGLFLITVVDDSPVPPRDVRNNISAFLRRGNGVFIASGVAYRASGMRSSIVRAIASAFAVHAQTTYLHVAKGTIEEVIKWFETDYHIRDGERLRQAIKESKLEE